MQGIAPSSQDSERSITHTFVHGWIIAVAETFSGAMRFSARIWECCYPNERSHGREQDLFMSRRASDGRSGPRGEAGGHVLTINEELIFTDTHR